MQTDFKHRDASKGSYIFQSQTVSNQNSDTELRRFNHEGKDFREFRRFRVKIDNFLAKIAISRHLEKK